MACIHSLSALRLLTWLRCIISWGECIRPDGLAASAIPVRHCIGKKRLVFLVCSLCIERPGTLLKFCSGRQDPTGLSALLLRAETRVQCDLAEACQGLAKLIARVVGSSKGFPVAARDGMTDSLNDLTVCPFCQLMLSANMQKGSGGALSVIHSAAEYRSR